MAPLDLVLRGGSVILPQVGRQTCDIGLRDGRIAAILAPGEGDAAETLAVAGLVVMPGAIDVHLHLGHGNDIARPRVPKTRRRRVRRRHSAASPASCPI
jgi:dihydropyrimidinase/allantoinase